MINFTKHNHVLYYVKRVDLYSVETVIIDLKTIFIVFINAGKIFTLFSYKMLLSAHNLLYYCVLRVSPLDVPSAAQVERHSEFPLNV